MSESSCDWWTPRLGALNRGGLDGIGVTLVRGLHERGRSCVGGGRRRAHVTHAETVSGHDGRRPRHGVEPVLAGSHYVHGSCTSFRFRGAGFVRAVSALFAFAQGTPGITQGANYLSTGFFPARTARSSSPYFSSFDGPIPLMRSIPARLDGFTSAIASSVASENTTNAG